MKKSPRPRPRKAARRKPQAKRASAAPVTLAPSREVSIQVAHPRLRVDRPRLQQAIYALDSAAAERFGGGPPPGELSIAFLTDPALAQLHGDFLADPSTTDVITFEGEPTFGTAGEICVSADTAQNFATQHGHEFSRELTLYVVHGWLHLAGYDDLEPAKKRKMRAAEARAMRQLEPLLREPLFSWKPAATRGRRSAKR